MRYDPDRHHRRSIRIGGYDYSQAGAYFVTICTFERVLLFGNVVDGEMRLNETGRIVQQVWVGLADRFVAAHLDTFVVMPNHVHAVVMLTEGEGAMNHAPTDVGGGVGAQFIAPRTADMGAHPLSDEPMAAGVTNEGVMNHAPTIGQIVRALKAVSARRVRQVANDSFAWQRNYYEHVVRNEAELNRIRQYIADNPGNWATDLQNPSGHPPSLRQKWQV